MKTRERDARDREKRLTATTTGEVARLLESGERVSTVIPVHVGVHPTRRFALVYTLLGSAVGAGWFYFVMRHHPDLVVLFAAIVAAPGLVIAAILGPVSQASRNLVLTDRRVLLVGPTRTQFLARRRRVIRTQEFPLDSVRVDSVRHAFPRRFVFGLRRNDGSTTEIYVSKQWLAAVEWLASCLDSGVAAPRRRDVLSAWVPPTA